MRLDERTCRARLAEARHGVFATVHPERGVDPVPVVFALVGDAVVLPVDAVKAKSGARLQRLVNLGADPRCALLVEHYDEDWSRLWWVRVHGRAIESAASPEHVAALAERYEQYRHSGSVTSVVVVAPDALAGWAAG